MASLPITSAVIANFPRRPCLQLACHPASRRLFICINFTPEQGKPIYTRTPKDASSPFSPFRSFRPYICTYTHEWQRTRARGVYIRAHLAGFDSRRRLPIAVTPDRLLDGGIFIKLRRPRFFNPRYSCARARAFFFSRSPEYAWTWIYVIIGTEWGREKERSEIIDLISDDYIWRLLFAGGLISAYLLVNKRMES